MKKTYLIIAVAVGIFFVPIFFQPQYYLGRDNDLYNFFWPIIALIKKSVVYNHTLPFWNPHMLSGTPLLPDPQSQMFYLPNIFFLILSDKWAFIFSAYLHLLLGSIFVFLIFNKLFKIKSYVSIFASVIYGISSKNAALMVAGHFGLVNAQAWIPIVIYGSLINSPLILALGMSGLYFTHTITFILAAPLSAALFAIVWWQNENKLNHLVYYIFSAVITFGLIAISFLHQLEWAKLTARVAIANDHQIHPIWNSYSEIIANTLFPQIRGTVYLQGVDVEKWIYVGLVVFVLSLFGFLKLKIKYKLLFTLLIIFSFVLIPNNLSPVYEALIRQNWYAYLRVSTRVWFIVYIFVLGLAGYGLSKIKNKKLIYLIICLGLIENITVSWARLTTPIVNNKNYIDNNIYEVFAKDDGLYRIYCTDRCIPILEAVRRNLELVDGYSTLIQSNYYEQAQKLTGANWNYYSLAIPPIGSYLNGQPQPDAARLGKYNTKYILSIYKLTDPDFEYIGNYGDYMLYQNKLFLPRSSTGTKLYQPNKIVLKSNRQEEITVANVYNPFWKAETAKGKMEIRETEDGLMMVSNPDKLDNIVLSYEPESFKIGAAITAIAVFLVLVILVIDKKLLLS